MRFALLTIALLVAVLFVIASARTPLHPVSVLGVFGLGYVSALLFHRREL